MSNSSTYSDLKKKIESAINDDSNPLGKLFGLAEQKTGFSRNYLFLGLIAFLSIYLVIGYGVELLSAFLGFVYPAYASIRAIESHDKSDDTKWLTYWVVFAFVEMIQYPFAFLLPYLPAYFLFKCVFYTWCFLPVCDGSKKLYVMFLQPYFAEIEKDMKNLSGDLKKKIGEAATRAVLDDKKE